MKLRYYQQEAEDSIFNYFANGGTGNPILAMPTGTGKSLVIGSFITRVVKTWPGQRIIKLTHVKELIAQNLEKLLAFWPQAPVGVFSAGLGRREGHCPITFAGIASVAKIAESFGHVDLVLVDECHLISPSEETLYRKFIDTLKKRNPNLKVIGFTATPYRLGVGLLTQGGLFTDICYDITGLEAFNRLVAEGYLTRLVPKPTKMEYDLSKVRTVAGEFNQTDMQSAVDKDELTFAACKELISYSYDRHHGLIFASGVQHAINVAHMMEALGETAVVIHSKMKGKERDKAITEWKAGKYKWAVNNGVLTTGIDFPGIDIISVMRGTKSASLWVQMLGRGTRPVYAPGYDLETIIGRVEAIANGPKPNCLVLDFAGNIRTLGPINDPKIPRAKGKSGGGDAPVRLCEACGTYNHASARYCEHCGQEFPRELKIKQTASTDEIMVGSGPKLPKTEVFKVDKVVYKEHRKEGRPPSIQVSYFCGLRMFKEWVNLEHPQSFVRHKAHDWWRARAYTAPPESTFEAMMQINDLRTPTHIRVWVDKPQYPEVMAHDFSGTGFEGA